MKKNNKRPTVLLTLALMLGVVGSTTTFAAGPATINLGSAADYAILSKTAITTTGVTSITGDIGISPAFSTDTTGFSLVLDSSGELATSDSISGRVYAADYTAPTPATLTTAVSDMEAAYTDGATRTPGTGASNLNLGGGTLNGQNLVPGTYTWDSNVSITDEITFTGSANDVWILQISGNLSIEANKQVVLAGGALPENIFWVVAGTTTLKPGSTFNGIILAGPGASTIAMQDGATLHGRALGQTDVTLIGNTITAVAPVSEPEPATLHIVKTVVNDDGGTATASDFTIDVAGTNASPGSFAGSEDGVDVTLDAGSYEVTETNLSNYSQSNSSDCSGTIAAGETKTCTITNDDIAAVVDDVPDDAPVASPVIHVTKVPNPLVLSVGGGIVTYTNKVTNPGTVALSNVFLTDDTCSSMVYVSGDTNSNLKLETTETWTYTCLDNLTTTTVNTVTASGEANGLTATDFAIATVVVNAAVPKFPNTGFPPGESNIPWNGIVLAGTLAILTSLYFARRKQVV